MDIGKHVRYMYLGTVAWVDTQIRASSQQTLLRCILSFHTTASYLVQGDISTGTSSYVRAGSRFNALMLLHRRLSEDIDKLRVSTPNAGNTCHKGHRGYRPRDAMLTLFAAPSTMHHDVDIDRFHTIGASQYTFTDISTRSRGSLSVFVHSAWLDGDVD